LLEKRFPRRKTDKNLAARMWAHAYEEPRKISINSSLLGTTRGLKSGWEKFSF
jgi:hypothetical protein